MRSLLCVGIAVVAGYNPLGGDLCATLNNCNGHGFCNTATKVCTCQVGWGAPTDISIWKTPDCSLRTCPAGLSWNSVPTSATTGHTVLAECSDMGICNTITGECNCFPGFQGLACELSGCPNACSGHGRCLSMRYLASQAAALPLSPATTYYGLQTTTTWDQERIFGCVCDSAWPVGLASGQTQEPEWFGADCSLRHCPSNNDPLSGVTDTDCAGVAAAGSASVGALGNLCHIECSNRGICNYKDGSCACFEGFLGVDCSVQVVG
ncbi:hypothetical protein SPRG_07129 [Saprolegnia parasitica CBS 223.65]|uniref:EGF-like domain-containing protein n=1 Tax=Saprolegnia parasitica (strain CBS 223.65) TaxID=695850 RepID=A0A067CMU3_SAPPC|nr:hypothetical protein SPRG_07129 [Saprolegnia parasitica CBS 223.65]KDO27856.1 hypothetical protein SPRG_07129 [Saprolegnia parasitica CBS 223.65]|eukprot:XP_012201316.1 hypothetical protein SPRG_07129 [Saprolegnia parasitica CBS 223.65]